MLKVVGLLCLVVPLYGQIPGLGGCPANVDVVPNFSLDDYLGQWYEYERYPFIFEAGGKCTYARYSALPNGTVSVYNFQINAKTNRRSEISGTAEVVTPGKLIVRFARVPSFVGGSNYWVLGTDYTRYAVVYSCTDFFGILHSRVVWVLTRERKPSEEVIADARRVLKQNSMWTRFLMKTNQDNCTDGK